MFRGSVILFALAVNSYTIWQALGAQTVPVETAVIHFLIALPIGGILLGVLRMATTTRPAKPGKATGQAGGRRK